MKSLNHSTVPFESTNLALGYVAYLKAVKILADVKTLTIFILVNRPISASRNNILCTKTRNELTIIREIEWLHQT